MSSDLLMDKSSFTLDGDKSNLSDIQVRPERISVKDAIIDLYLNVKVRSSEEVSGLERFYNSNKALSLLTDFFFETLD